jgi:hypothetical protein
MVARQHQMGRKAMSKSAAKSDNLELITGIGPDAHKWLAEAFNVRTFAALAALPVDDLVSQIRVENKPWLRWARNWPADAAARAAEIEAAAKPLQPAASSSRKQEDGWDALAFYIIEFQSRQLPGEPVEQRTTVSYQGPGPETLPVAVGRDELCEWIFDHLHSILPDQSRGSIRGGAKAMSGALHPGPVSIRHLYLFQPAGALAPLCSFGGEQPMINLVTADQPFDLELILEGSPQPASGNGRSALNVQFLVKDWSRRTPDVLKIIRPEAIQDRQTYSARLQDISLARGNYRLEVLVLGHPKPAVLGSMKVPMLNVW